MRRAFTLIELLIVVAIIAILAAIAVPNFLAAQVRSKVSRTHADLRTLATALETYRVDNNSYPRAELFMGLGQRMVPLSTPIAYITSQPLDPFYKQAPNTLTNLGGMEPNYGYASGNIYFGPTNQFSAVQYTATIYSLAGRGPDSDLFFGGYCMSHPQARRDGANLRGAYDPTNGTVSAGDIFRLSAGTLGQ
ncbi:hypothetical protein BH09SUM1_BH09SUM1_07300 [soil metagenome]